MKLSQNCLNCHATDFWKLKDGRLKCCSCGERYRWKTAWEGIRLANESKINLLKLFISGIPASRMDIGQSPSTHTRERFLRLIRATLAFEENCSLPFTSSKINGYALPQNRSHTGFWPGSFHDTIVVGITHLDKRVQLVSLNNEDEKFKVFQSFSNGHTPPGMLHFTQDSQAYAWFKLRNDYLLFPKVWSSSQPLTALNRIEKFWNFVQQRLSPYRSLPKRFFHLYLSECSYRFNHQDKDLFPLVYELLQKTNLSDIRSVAFPKL